jgi:Tol biopolymer transport system component
MNSIKPLLKVILGAALLAIIVSGNHMTGQLHAQSADGNSGATAAASYEPDGTAGASAPAQYSEPAGNMGNNESILLSNTYQLVTDGLRSGEGYFSGDGSHFIYQSEAPGDNPFYQIYLMNLATGDTNLVSPGSGLTTCSWVHPDLNQLIFASTHEDPQARQKQAQEIAMRNSGEVRAYAWDYDEHYDIFQANTDGSGLVNLTGTPGYDAEGSYSSDGSKILFASNREAYQRTLSLAEQRLFDDDSSYFMDLYIMDADGSNVEQLTFSPGYDGGPFFSADDQQIVWRRFNPDGNSAEIWTMDVDGSNQRQLTAEAMVSWGPYFHPSGDYIIYSSNVLGNSNFELFIVDVDGSHEPVRVTNTAGTDILPVFSPAGTELAWSSTRTADGTSQIYMADWNDARARELLELD